MKSKRKLKRRTLKQWAAFARGKNRKARRYEDEIHLHRFENQVILRKMADLGGATTAGELYRTYPEVFSGSLPRALKRMAKEGLIARDGGSNHHWFGGPTYRLPVTVKKGKRAVA